MSQLRRLTALAVLSVGTLALAACGGGGDDDRSGAPTATVTTTTDARSNETAVEFSLVDFAIEGPAAAPAGPIRFAVANGGTTPHEFVIVRSDAARDALPVEAGVVLEGEIDVIGEIEQFPAGEERTSTFTLEPGRYLLAL